MKTNLINQRTGCLTARLFAAALLGLAAQTASAQSGTWTNKANGNWSTAINWAGGTIASGQDNTADFAAVTWTNGHQTTLDAPYTVGTVKFGNVANVANTNYLLGANTLTLQTSTGNPTINASNQNAIVGAPLASSQQVLVSGTVVAITNAANNTGQTGGWILQASQEGFLGQGALGGGPVTVGNAVGSGGTGFNMIDTAAAGTAPVVLTNNFTIQTIRWIAGQNGCTFNAQPVTILGTVFLNSGLSNVRDIAVQNSLTLGGVVSGGGNYGVIIGALGGTLNLTNSGNTFGPAVTLNVAGTIGASSDGALGFFNNPIKFTSASGTFRALSSFAMGVSRQMVFTAAGNIDTTTNTLEVDGSITGAGAITKNGTGTLNLTAANTFTGGLTLNAGTFEVSGSGSLATTAGLTVLTNVSLLFQDSASVPNVASYTVNNGGKFLLVGSPTIKSTAPITVNAGGLVDVSGLSSLPWAINSGQILSGSGVVTGAVTCASGAILAPGTTGTAGTLTFNNNLSLSGQTFQFDLSTNTVEGNGTNDELVVGGNLTLSGGEKILLNYVNGSLSAGTYKLIKFGGTLTGTFALATAYPNVTIDNGVGTPGYVTLVVSAPSIAQNLIWKGDGTANVWDISTTANWVTNYGGTTFNYSDPAKVTLDDFGSNNVPVTLNTVVYPIAVTFNVTNRPYALAGSGKISGPAVVTINGGNAVTNGLASDYTGGTVINGASKLVLLDGSAPGSGGVQLNAATGTVIANNSSALNLPNRIWGNAVTPNFVQKGSGTTTLANTADNSGLAATVNAGTLQLAASSSSSLHALGGNSTINTGGTLQLGGSGGDQILNGLNVTNAGGTFDANGQSETFTALNGYGSVLDSLGGATLTLTATPGLNVSGGTMNANVNMTFGAAVVGFQVQSGATLNWLGGTLTYGSSTAGTVQGGGVFNMSGGAIGSSTYLALGGGTGTAIANFSGGTFTQPGEFLQCYGGGSFVTVSSNAVMNLHFWSYGDRFGSTNYFNGGLTKLDAFAQRGNSTAWACYFNGGTIQAKSTVAHFLPNALLVAPNQHAYISTNGLIFDNQTFSVTIDQNLEHDSSLGASLDGGLTKLGSGTLTLAGTNSFNGSITNAAGTLVFQNNGSYNNVVIGDNATNQVNVVAAGTSLTNSTLTIGSTGTGTQGLNFSLGTFGTPTAPLITVNGAATNSGNVLITLIAPVLSPGSIPLLKYGSMDAANFASTWTINPYPYVSLTLTNDTVRKLVSIIVVPGVTPKWKGDLSSAWDTTTLNWRSNGIAAFYTEPTAPGTPVTFDDTAVNFTVDISAATVNPLFINMTNGTHDYAITGSAGIGGTGALIKNGAGALIFNNTAGANTYSGITTVNGGSVVVEAANLLSPNSAMTFNTSTLILSNNNQTFASGGSISLNNSALVGNATLTGGGSSLNLNNSTNFTLAPVLAGSFNLNQNGSGEMNITNNNSYTGPTTIYNGSVRVQNGNGLGVGGFNTSYTQIQPGGSLILDGSFSIPESLIMNGTGFNGVGCLVVTNGNVVANGSPCQVLTATIYVSAGSSIDFQGAAGGNSTTLYSGGLTKSGPGDLLVGGLPANACTANPIVVAQGRFISTNCNTTSFITVNSGATLAGNGPFNGVINVLAGGNLTPNLYGTIETMTSAAGLTNAGAFTLQLLKTATTTNADQINATAAFVNTGTLTVITNLGSTLPLAAGDSFKLFTLTNYTALTGLTPTLPVLSTGLAWTNKLAVNGTIAVVATVSTTPFALGTSVSGNQLTLTWPTDHTGWRLQVQTNSLSTGLNTNWVDVAGATTVSSVTNTIDSANGSVFYRMIYP